VSLVIVLVVALAMDAPRVGSEPVPTASPRSTGARGERLPAPGHRPVGPRRRPARRDRLAAGRPRRLRGLLPATLAAIVGGIVAFAATDLTLGAAAAGGRSRGARRAARRTRRGDAGGARDAVAIAGTAVLVAVTAAAPVAATLVLGGQGPIPGAGSAPSGVLGTGAPTEAGAVVGLLALAVAAVVALRLGVIPFHLRVPRLTDVAPPISLPLLLAWIPVPLGVAAIAISDQLIAPLALPLDGERTIIVLVALTTLVAGALAAFMQDDLRHAVGYLVIADAGIVLLGFAALDPAAWGRRASGWSRWPRPWPVAARRRSWRTGFDPRVPDLRGWLRTPRSSRRARRRRARDLRPPRLGGVRGARPRAARQRTSPGSSSSPGSRRCRPTSG
jgi:hypothetical protein